MYQCLADVRHVAAGREHGAGLSAGARLRRRDPPPVGRFGHPGVLQPAVRVPAAGLHRVVSGCVSVGASQDGTLYVFMYIDYSSSKLINPVIYFFIS